MKLLSLATALLGFAALVSAQEVDKRLIDISETDLEVKEIQNKDIDTFVVTVQRTDDLLADDGTFLAERVMAVAFKFDVQNHEVLLNKVALPLDGEKESDPVVVTVEVAAGVIVGPALSPETKMEDLMDAFDEGLVTVQVTATTEYATADDGTQLRRVTLQETIVEVNGQEIVQTDAAQQVIEILADGTLGSFTPLQNINEKAPATGGCQEELDAYVQAFEHWFHALNWPAFVALMVAGACAGLASANIVRLLVIRRREARYARLQQREELEAGLSEDYIKIGVEDKKLLEEDEKL
ncbi:hypothetical protein BG004_006200 [Podila humilis]|nr:hypothetical protein BG004_006200 [Podila humilis]